MKRIALGVIAGVLAAMAGGLAYGQEASPTPDATVSAPTEAAETATPEPAAPTARATAEATGVPDDSLVAPAPTEPVLIAPATGYGSTASPSSANWPQLIALAGAVIALAGSVLAVRRR